MRQFFCLFKKEWREWQATILIALLLIAAALAYNNFRFWKDVKFDERMLKEYPHLYEGSPGTMMFPFQSYSMKIEVSIQGTTFKDYRKFVQEHPSRFLDSYLQLHSSDLLEVNFFVLGTLIAFILAMSIYRERKNSSLLYLASLPNKDVTTISAKLALGLSALFLLLVFTNIVQSVTAKISLSQSTTMLAEVIKPLLPWSRYLGLNWEFFKLITISMLIPGLIFLILYLIFSSVFTRIHPVVVAMLCWFLFIRARLIYYQEIFVTNNISLLSYEQNSHAVLLPNLTQLIRNADPFLPVNIFTILFTILDLVLIALLFWGLIRIYRRKLRMI